jgi:serine/threonine-protein kinase
VERLTAALADRYRLERELGAGGMATVYLAEDLKHHRMVAIKVLRPELAASLGSARFIREIEVAARLQHPHILPLHDSGEADGFLYYVMPYVEGVSLRERLAQEGELPVADAVRILTEVVEALAYAHRQGVVHRDLKPDNIMLSGRHPLIMDFGIAKAVSLATSAHAPTTVGVALGTPAYMAPEQATGDPHVDHRADLYAVGVIGYELLTGEPPFTGMSAQQILAAQVTADPAPIATGRATVPPGLDALLMRCLQKRPADRPQSAEEILQLLETMATPSAGLAPTAARTMVPPTQARWRRGLLIGAGVAVLAAAAIAVFLLGKPRAIPSVVVLPFVNASGNADLEYLSDGIAEEIINSLTQVQSLKVIARPTAFSYKGRPAVPREIGAQLKVRGVVMGRLTQRGEMITVQVDLVDAVEGAELWGEKFERRLGEIASLQQEINRRVASVLRVQLTSEQKKRLARPQPENAEVFQLYLRGRQFLSEMSTGAEYLKSLDYFKQAVAKDPSYAKGWAGLAYGYAYLSFQELEPTGEVMPKAREAAQKALALDPDLAEAHTSMGIVMMSYDKDLPGAEAEFRRAMELNPGEDFSRHWYAHYLEFMQRFEEANAELRRVVEIDPLSPMYTGDLAMQYLYMRQPEQVIEIALKGKSPDSVSPWEVIALALAYEMLGRREESLATIAKMTATDAIFRGYAGALLARQGKRAAAESILEELKARKGYVPAFYLALVYLGLGQTDESFRYLEKAYDERSSAMNFSISLDPQWGVVHDDPRYQDLLRRLRLPPPVKSRNAR